MWRTIIKDHIWEVSDGLGETGTVLCHGKVRKINIAPHDREILKDVVM